MRILHTADWHLADRLGRIDRTQDLRRAVERVAGYCASEKVDVLLVAGDLFSELASLEALRESIRHLQEVFAGFLRDGGTILTLTGNHDKENFCQTLRHAMNLAAPGGEEPGTLVPPGRLYLATEPSLIRLEDRVHGNPVQFLLMPYPTPTRYLGDVAGQRYQGLDEKNRALMAAFTRTLHELREHETFNTDLPAVLAAHISLQSCDLGGLFRLSEQEDIVLADDQIPTGFNYVALGHIHKPQFVGQPHIRYSGSIERMDLGEQNDAKGVVLFDLGPEGVEGDFNTQPLVSTPIYEIEVLNPAEDIPKLKERYPNSDNHLVRIRCTYTAGRDNREETLRELETLFPRWYDRQITESSALGPSLHAGGASGHKSFRDTVRDYLEQELQNHADDQRLDVLARAERLMDELEQ